MFLKVTYELTYLITRIVLQTTEIYITEANAWVLFVYLL